MILSTKKELKHKEMPPTTHLPSLSRSKPNLEVFKNLVLITTEASIISRL